MKRLLRPLFAAAALLYSGSALASGPCTPGPNWSASWTGAGQTTTYTISAPPCVYVNVPFDITLTVTDSKFNVGTAVVGVNWSVLDNGVLVPAPEGYSSSGTVVTLTDGVWVNTIPVTYTTLVVNHTLEFKFADFGDKVNQAMGWTLSSATLSGLTVDPYPPGTEPPPVEPPPVVEPPAADPVTDPAADPGTGCSTGGGAGLLAFAALALGARRRRRT